MKRIVFVILFFVISFEGVYAVCNEGQIDVNTASLEELDNLYGIGPVKAQAIIDSRSFDSIDKLINVKGIGEITLRNIKEEGLACVDKEKKVEKEIEDKIFKEVEEDQNNNEELKKLTGQSIEASVIKLAPKVIKTEENSEGSNNNRFAIYGFVFFCILLAFLFLLRKNKLKNEFN